MAGKAGSTKKTPGRPKKTQSKQQHSRSSRSKAATAEHVRFKNQMRAVVLFALAIFVGCLVLIEGESLWRVGHNFMLGFFGIWAIIWPILMIYVAVVFSLEKTDNANFETRLGMIALVILLVCGTASVFSGDTPPDDLTIWQQLGYAFASGMGRGTNSFIGALIALPFVAAFGSIGAKIALLLILFVAVMILTGTTLVKLFRAVSKPVTAVSHGIQRVRDRMEEEEFRQTEQFFERSKDAQVDIDLDDDTVSRAREEAQSLFPKRSTDRDTNTNPPENEKRSRLLKAFGAQPVQEEASQPVADKSQQPEESVAVPAEPQPEQPKEQTVDTAKAVPPVQTAQPPVQDAADADAARAVEAFIRQKEAEDKKETAPLVGAAIQPKNEETHYSFPPISMLEPSQNLDDKLEVEELQASGKMLVDTLKSFGVQTSIVHISRGPSVTRYELQPAPGVKISRITGLADDIAMNLAAVGVRIEAPIPGKAAVGIEVPNKVKTTVRMRDLIESISFVTAKSRLTVALGRDIAGQVRVADLAKMPHLLIAGTTGSGKSVCINAMIISLLYKATPDEVRFLMIDPKVVELGVYNDIPHLLTPVVTDPRKAAGALGWAVNEMLSRYRTFAAFNVRDINGYNHLAAANHYQDENGQPMPKMFQIVIIIDELSDLMMASPSEVEDSICRLAQMARAAGMHLIVATQRPSVDVVTGLIKANIPSRIAFAVSSAVDSRTILDTGGAEKLLGQGDMLFAPIGAQKPIRIQGCFVTDAEIESIATFVKTQQKSDYDEKVMEEIEKNASAKAESSESGEDAPFNDERMEDAIKCVIEAGQASTSLLQRRLRLGYARAGRLIDEMEQMGIVGPHEGSKPRQVLMTYQQYLERNMLKQDESRE